MYGFCKAVVCMLALWFRPACLWQQVTKPASSRMNILYNVACQWQMAMNFGQKTILPSCQAEYLGKFVVAMIGCHKTNFPCCVFVTSGGDLKWKFECCQHFFFWEIHCPVQVHTSLKSLLQWVVGACEPPIRSLSSIILLLKSLITVSIKITSVIWPVYYSLAVKNISRVTNPHSSVVLKKSVVSFRFRV